MEDTQTIDITPEGCKTAEGLKRVAKAQKEWDDATYALATATREFMDTHEDNIIDAMEDWEETHSVEGFRDDLHQIRALLGAQSRKSEAFLRAVTGAPER